MTLHTNLLFSPDNKFKISVLLSGIAFLILGLIYYVNMREYPPYLLSSVWDQLYFLKLSFITSTTNYPDWTYAIPTFLHVTAFSLLTISIISLNQERLYLVPIFWVLINIVFEILQMGNIDVLLDSTRSANSISHTLFYLVTHGDFAWADIVAAVLAGTYVIGVSHVLWPHQVLNKSAFDQTNQLSKGPIFVLLAMGIVSITGSYPCGEAPNGREQSHCNTGAKPVYLSYDKLRQSSISIEENYSLMNTGKIYIYQNYLIINSLNEGIHIYDNTSPNSPQHLLYIHIPGNLDIAVRDGFMYADSYIDLVVFDINNIGTDINSVIETHRVEDVFPYDPYQNIPDDIYLGFIDSTKGVVVGYTLK